MRDPRRGQQRDARADATRRIAVALPPPVQHVPLPDAAQEAQEAQALDSESPVQPLRAELEVMHAPMHRAILQ